MRAFLLLTVLLLLVSCEKYTALQQVKTFANLRIVSEQIERQKRDGRISRQSILDAVNRVNGGKDAWGTPILIEIRQERERTRYLLVSRGGDRKLDVATVGDYWEAPETSVQGRRAADIVIRDGRPVTDAGK